MNLKEFIKNNIKKVISGILNIGIYGNPEKLFDSYEHLSKMSLRYEKIIQYYTGLSLKLFLYNFINKTKNKIKNSSEKKAEITSKMKKIFEEINETEKMFLSKIFFLLEIFDDEISENIMKFAIQTKNKDYRYWTTMDISKMTFLLQKGFYPEYYNDRKKLFKIISEENNFIAEKKISPNRNTKRIIIITYLFDKSLFNSMQRIASIVANEMSKRFDEIMIISLESFNVSESEKHKINTIFSRESCKKDFNEIKNLFEKKVTAKFMIGDYKQKYQNALNIIYEYDPDAILDISDEYSAISYLYSRSFPTLYIPMRNSASSSYFDIVCGPKWKYELINKKYNSIDNSKVINWIFPEYVPPQSDVTYTRKDLKVSDDDFIIITIGNNSKVITDDLAYEICSILKKHDRLIWLLVGENAPDYIHKNYNDLIKERKIIEWGFEKQLVSLCKICNILLRANTTGGSGATAIAAMQGNPIAMTNFMCDPMRWLGYDFSNINTFSELAEYIVKLSEDEELYAKARKNTLDKVNSAINTEKCWDNYAEIINETIKNKKRRK